MTLGDAAKEGHLSKYNGRIIFVLRRVLGKKEVNNLALLEALGKHDEIQEKYGTGISLNINEFSSNSKDHVIEVNDKKYYLVGSNDQFLKQFKDE